MSHKAADRIRNVALIGHRGAGKTESAEAMLFEAGVVNRLGSVDDGSTVCDPSPTSGPRDVDRRRRGDLRARRAARST